EEFVKRTKGYQFTKSLYNYDTFDSSIEFQFANQRHYFPDFLVIDENDIHWLVEIKDDNNPDPRIEEKNQAAKE
ncbi:2871_t:CDS:2, partial [Cetraspora pellucida]